MNLLKTHRRTGRRPSKLLVVVATLVTVAALAGCSDGVLHRWSPEGYTERTVVPVGVVQVLTPRCTVDVIGAGYLPQIDASALV